MGRSSAREGFYHNRDALPASDAGGAEAETASATAKRVQQVQDDPRAARAERVADRHGAAVDVGALAVELELLLHGKILGGERFVDLDQVHVIEREAGV